MRAFRNVLPPALVAFAALVLPACGSSSHRASSKRSSLLGPVVDTDPVPPVTSKLDPPLRQALRRTAAAPTAHVMLSGELVSGSGDFSAAKDVASLHVKTDCVRSDEVIVGTAMYLRSPSGLSKRRQLRKIEDAVDVWVDRRDGYIRRAGIDAAGSDEETVDLSRFGEPVHVTVPPADETIEPGQSVGHEQLSVVGNKATCHK